MFALQTSEILSNVFSKLNVWDNDGRSQVMGQTNRLVASPIHYPTSRNPFLSFLNQFYVQFQTLKADQSMLWILRCNFYAILTSFYVLPYIQEKMRMWLTIFDKILINNFYSILMNLLNQWQITVIDDES